MKKHPNVLLIVGDQHRYDCLGCAGNQQIMTPALDSLAANGTLYTDAFCPYPVCTPSRYSMLTGLYPHQHGGWSNHSTLAPGYMTFPKVLRKAGYQTACVGKMHFSPTYLDVGFDRMLLAEQDGPGRMEDDYHTWLMEQGKMDCFDIMDQRREYRDKAGEDYWRLFGSGASDLPEEYHSTTWIGRHAEQMLRDWQPEQANLLMVGFIKPHHPFDPPESWLQKYDPEKLKLLDGWLEQLPNAEKEKQPPYFPNEPLNEATMRRIMACYYACISQMDFWIGRMVEVLKEKGLYDDTLIIYTSDHGEYLGYHHLLLKFNYMYEPLARVPLIVKRPRQMRAQREEKLVANADLPSSILQWVGENPAEVAGSPIGNAAHEYVFSEVAMRDGWNYMVRGNRYKLLVSAKESRLFDLKNDPMEMHELPDDAQSAAIRQSMQAALFDWLAQQSVTPSYLDLNAPERRSGIQRARSAETLTAYFTEHFVPARMKGDDEGCI